MEENITYKSISPGDLLSKYNDHEFWYVFDEAEERIYGFRTRDRMERIGYVFTDTEDAETWKTVLRKSVDLQDYKHLVLASGTWPEIDAYYTGTLGESIWVALEHTEAQKLFENYQNMMLSSEGMDPYD